MSSFINRLKILYYGDLKRYCEHIQCLVALQIFNICFYWNQPAVPRPGCMCVGKPKNNLTVNKQLWLFLALGKGSPISLEVVGQGLCSGLKCTVDCLNNRYGLL